MVGIFMETVVITCETIKDEVLLLMERAGLNYKTIWLDPGLHRSPARLRARIIEELGNLPAPSRVLMPMGCCGGGMDDIPAGPHTLIVPRCDDCLTLLLGSMNRRLKIQSEAATYFLTAGWLRGVNDLVAEYKETVARLGAEKADWAYKMTMSGYKRYMVIETGAFDPEPCRRKMAGLLKLLNLKLETTAGDLSWLEKLLTGPWEAEAFSVTPPNQVLRLLTDG